MAGTSSESDLSKMDCNELLGGPVADFLDGHFKSQVPNCGPNNRAYLLASDLLGLPPSPATPIPLPHTLEDPLVRAVKVLFDSAHLAAVEKILKGVKKDSINLIDKVERGLPFAQRCMHSIPRFPQEVDKFSEVSI